VEFANVTFGVRIIYIYVYEEYISMKRTWLARRGWDWTLSEKERGGEVDGGSWRKR
jgi:hypothetical protein